MFGRLLCTSLPRLASLSSWGTNPRFVYFGAQPGISHVGHQTAFSIQARYHRSNRDDEAHASRHLRDARSPYTQPIGLIRTMPHCAPRLDSERCFGWMYVSPRRHGRHIQCHQRKKGTITRRKMVDLLAASRCRAWWSYLASALPRWYPAGYAPSTGTR